MWGIHGIRIGQRAQLEDIQNRLTKLEERFAHMRIWHDGDSDKRYVIWFEEAEA